MAAAEKNDGKPTKSAGRPLGPTGEAVRQNIKALRAGQGMSQNELSEQMKRLGRPIPALGIHRIEGGDRRVDVDDLMALSVALGVSPPSLLMPLINSGGEKDLVPITGWHKLMTASVVWRWLTAMEPLVHGTWLNFINRALPIWERQDFVDKLTRGND